MPLPRFLDVTTSFLATLARLGGGMKMGATGARPAERLILYEFEGCPFCRRAREAVSVLDLEVEIRPCPKKGPRYREAVKARGGKSMFPYLVDPNTDTEMYESADIVRYLFETYGEGGAPFSINGPLFLPSSMAASYARPLMGTFYAGDADKAPAEPLILYGVEASPYTRIAREALCALELAYVLRTTPIGSARWRELRQRGGKAMVPYLIDPNTDTEMYESADIRDYLYRTYGRG